ncbi:hypothetical protein [Bradyrhizobium sp. AUGA SZCCT0431]|uniref:hypothetical protein n=1 Tax=Bradyrhizobium sp. AUGA SZCCT0431 TaxID=2807674 RepID=UPI001BAB0578|nr:hypothetical protein [Bradyrhizobium sp. AUGA SZCCT0431]MBR1142493.1 hypothetical protein [Bradyrhizobium sp. AUGA SZCCT0431]
MRATTNPVLAALALARMRAAPMFTKWCELNGLSACPAAPANVAKFVSDCAALGIERLWPAVLEISKLHSSVGLADPTLGGVAAAAISDLAGIEPPRSWPEDRKHRFKSLPYDLQVYVAAHELQREKALRRAQNEAAIAKQKLTACQQPEVRTDEESKADENVARPTP